MKGFTSVLLSLIVCVLIGNVAFAKGDLSQNKGSNSYTVQQTYGARISQLETEIRQLKTKLNELERQLNNKADISHTHTCSYSGGSSVYCY